MSIIDDFKDIARRVNRKPEIVATVKVTESAEANAAINKLKAMGYRFDGTAWVIENALGRQQVNGIAQLYRNGNAQAAANMVFRPMNFALPQAAFLDGVKQSADKFASQLKYQNGTSARSTKP